MATSSRRDKDESTAIRCAEGVTLTELDSPHGDLPASLLWLRALTKQLIRRYAVAKPLVYLYTFIYFLVNFIWVDLTIHRRLSVFQALANFHPGRVEDLHPQGGGIDKNPGQLSCLHVPFTVLMTETILLL